MHRFNVLLYLGFVISFLLKNDNYHCTSVHHVNYKVRMFCQGDNITCYHMQVLTRYLLQKLFGPGVAKVTSNGSILYLDLPSNMVSLSLPLSSIL